MVTLVRILISVVFGLVLGTFIMLAVLANDIKSAVRAYQVREDQRLTEVHLPRVQAEEAVLVARLQEGQAELKAAMARDVRVKVSALMDELITERGQVSIELSQVEAEKTAQTAISAQQQLFMTCEETGERSARCPASSGTPGQGENWILARDTAEVAEQKVLALNVDILRLTDRVKMLDAQITAARVEEEVPSDIRSAWERLQLAETDKLAFNPNLRLRELIESDPSRRVYSDLSFADQFTAMKRLLQDSPEIWVFFILLELAAILLESLLLVVSLASRPTEYHFARANGLIHAADAAMTSGQASYLEG